MVKQNGDLNEQKEMLVLMHGLGGGCAYFFPILKELVKYFDVILVDIIGFAGSSRPNDYDDTTIKP